MSEEEADRLEREEAAEDEKTMEQAKNDVIGYLDDKWKQVITDMTQLYLQQSC